MSTEELQDIAPIDVGAPDSPTVATTDPAPDTAPPIGRRRPRLDLGALGKGTGGKDGQRKRGKSMFGVLVNTLNKAKAEDKERNASEAAKKRQLIEQRLQTKLRKETDSVRRAEEAKKGKVSANRKEEDLQLKDSIYKLRRTRLPHLANFLLTSDVIDENDMDEDRDAPVDAPVDVSAAVPPRSHPPPLYYLPAVPTPSQEAFLKRRRTQFKDAAEKEWAEFAAERAAGIEAIAVLRKKAVEDDERERKDRDGDPPEDARAMAVEGGQDRRSDDGDEKRERDLDNGMDVDGGGGGTKEEAESAEKRGDDDEVEY